MNLRSLFRRRPERRNLDIDWDSGVPPAPGAVNMDQALRLGPVFAAGRLLASNVAGLPIQVYRKVGDTRRQIPTPSLLTQPTVQGTRNDWLFRAMTSLIYRGNAVGLIAARDSYGYPTGVEWIDPDLVQVIDQQPSGPGSFTDPIWYYRGRPTAASDLVHIPWFTLPGKVWGLSPIGAYASVVSTGLSAQQFSKDWFDSGGVPPGTFANANAEVDQQQAQIIKQRLVSAIRSHQPIVYGKDWEYKPVTVAPNEAKFVETMKLTATEIAAIYGIPPEYIGGETGSSMTYQTVEQQSINFVQMTLLPWLTKLEDAFSALLPRGQYVKFNVDALIRPDAQTRYNNYKIARDIGLMSQDEIRALEDLPPLPNGAGADYTPLSLLAAEAAHPAPAPGVIQGELVRRLELADGEARASTLPFGPGSHLWKYWTAGKGLARWVGAVHKWTTLHRLLVEEGVPAHEADGLTTNIIEAVLPGYMAQAHKKSS